MNNKKYEYGQKRESLSRRDFLQIGGLGLSAYALTSVMRPWDIHAQAPVNPQNTAKACIFIMLDGGPSHLDTFDIKPGYWTPQNFDVRTVDGINLPVGLFPKLATQARHIAVVRSLRAWSASHGIAQYWVQTGQDFNPAFFGERPSIGSVVAYDHGLHRRRRADVLPGYVKINTGGIPGNGFLSSLYSPFGVSPNSNGLGGTLQHPDGEARFNTRWDFLQQMDADLRTENPVGGRPLVDYNKFYGATRDMMYNSAVENAFKFSTGPRSDAERYGTGSPTGTGFGNACIVARNLVAAAKGTSFVYITLGGWDMHDRIYQPNAGLYSLGKTLDQGLGTLIQDMASRPGQTPGKSLLDETLIVMTGDFGRTPPNAYGGSTGINQTMGRDHWDRATFAFFAGGGIRGGRVLGETDEFGYQAIDYGWDLDRPARMEDVAATIYSALGINWTTEIRETPSRRVYQYVPGGPRSIYRPFDELFV
jgi:hypothetical protein